MLSICLFWDIIHFTYLVHYHFYFILGIPVTISSDAHESKNLSFYFQETVDLLKELGFSECKMLLNGVFQNIKL